MGALINAWGRGTALAVVGLLVLLAAMFSVGISAMEAKQVKGKFVNEAGPWRMNVGGAIKAQWSTRQYDKAPAQPIPLYPLSPEMLEQAQEPILVRLGHSSILLKLGEDYVLMDPVFSERASPVNWAGPRRFHPPPLSIDALPSIKAVIISHDHYDHLDKDSIRQLADKVEYFVTPLGVGRHLIRWGIPEDAIVEMDWWQELQLGDLTLAATPAQHFSGRGLFDRNETLWASWVIMGAGARVFFSGDTGYFDGFRDIGERYGPFDVTLIENGAYNPAWRDIHMMPEDSVRAHLDLQGKVMLPIHNSTFDLSLHPWYEPMERVTELASEQGITLATPIMGAPMLILDPAPTLAWWRDVAGEQVASTEDACTASC